MRRTQFLCECGSPHCAAPNSINDHPEPIVVYLAVGHVNGGGDFDASKVPPFVRRIMAMDLPRIEMHAACAPHVLARLLAETAPEPVAEPVAEPPAKPD